ncbi:MAG: NADH-quinone oxidoreductase subunit NuoN [Azonexus sp.]|jgi:NADH-quinone oxidoreductase subunit N|nr:NADH-quinone oxidoreductase subunit NuoN [Azonexus sp.]
MFDNFVVPNLQPAAPEIFLVVMASAILLIDLFIKDSRRTVTFALSVLTLLGCAVIQFLTWTPDITYTFSNMFVDDQMADVLKLFLYLAVVMVLFYSRAYVVDRSEMNKGEYYVLTLFATLGMMVMISANNFVTVYIGIELLSLSLYAMVAMNRASLAASEAAMKYFVLGALASGLLLYGMSMIYGATGSLEITAIAEVLRNGGANGNLLIFGLIFLIAGMAFKLGVVPFHMWIPDVYHGAPTSVTLLIGSAPKLAAFAIVMRLLVSGLFPLAAEWQNMLIIMAVLSMAIGNLAAIAQTNIKRMLAYSAISHMGFMLLGIVSGVVGSVDPVTGDIIRDARFALNAYSSAMFYVVSYVLMSLGTFGMILLMSRSGFEADTLDDFKGLNQRSPWFAAIMMMLMFSMAGIPFFIGFFAKFTVLMAVIAAGYIWFAIVAVLFSLIGAFYYLRVVKLMYFDAPQDETPIAADADMRLLISANGIAVALFGLFPQVIMTLCAFSLLRSLTP